MSYLGAEPTQQMPEVGTGTVETQDIKDGAVTAAKLAAGAAVPSQTSQSGKYLTTDGTTASWGIITPTLKITAVAYPDNDTAVDTAGAQTITITGVSFASTPTVYIGGTIAPSVTFVSSTTLTVTTPAKAAGTYDIYVVNPDGATAIRVYGISYSGVPTWTTAAGSLGTLQAAWTVQLQATSNSAVTYALTSGSTLPSGVTLSSSGLITGSNVSTEQTFNFSVTAIDAENQDTPRSFSITISLADAYFKYTTLLLTGDGTNSAQNNTFLDSSTNAFSITRNGNTTQGTFTPYGSNWSNFFDGTGDYLTAPPNAAFGFDADFTVEAWINTTEFGVETFYRRLFSTGADAATAFQVLFFNGSAAVSEICVYSNTFIITGTIPVADGAWHHIAISRSGTSMKLFVDGVQSGSTATTSQNFSSGTANGFYISRYPGGDGGHFKGNISNVRVVKGTAVYTGNFTPSTTPLTAITNTVLLTCQSNRFIDNSANNFTITKNGDVSVQRFNPFGTATAYSTSVIGGSGYFDGSGDYLAIPGGSHFSFASNDFTIEAWVYIHDATTRKYVFGPGTDTASHYDGFGLEIWDNRLCMWASSVANSWNLLECDTSSNRGNILIAVKAWTHIAVTRTGGNTFKSYVNGVLDRTFTVSGAISNNTNIQYNVGRAAYQSGTFYFNGLISDFRVVKGTAVYTGNFTLNTAPLTTPTNTSLLLNYTNAGILDNAMMNNLETVGNAQISTSVVKYGTGSMYFDGTGDYLKNVTTSLASLEGNFTIECWLYYTAHGSYGGIVSCANSDTSTGPTSGWAFVFYSTTNKLYFETGTGFSLQTTNTIPTSQWNHVAVVRSGSTITHYLNGVANGSGTSSAAFNVLSTNNFVIGVNRGLSSTMTGYIDDLRITKGYARYTATFTPPTAAFKLR